MMTTPNILQYAPGQQVFLALEITRTDGYRVDGYTFLPNGYDGYAVINRIFFPNLTTSSLYPLRMNKIDVGLYYHSFVLPTGASAVGSYLVDGYYYDATTLTKVSVLWQVLCSAPFGNFTARPI